MTQVKFGYRRSMLHPNGENLVQTKAKRFDRRRMWKSERGDILRPRDFVDEHLLNTIRFLNKISFQNAMAEARLQDSMSESAQGAGLPDIDGPDERYPILPMLIREMKRRGLKEKEVFSSKEITRPFSTTLFSGTDVPVTIVAATNALKQETVDIYFGLQDGGSFEKAELVELRDTLTKVLAGWK